MNNEVVNLEGAAHCSEKEVGSCNNLKDKTGLFTSKRLINSRRNKSLFSGTCATVFVAVVSVLLFYGCRKDSVVSNDNNFVTHASNEDYPFVLPEAMAPYQYAVYPDDANLLWEHIQARLEYPEGNQEGYFTFSCNTNNTLICYGFISTTSIYYDSTVFVEDPDNSFVNIDNIDNEDDYACYAIIITKKYNKLEKWGAKQIAKGKYFDIQVKGEWYIAVSKKCDCSTF